MPNNFETELTDFIKSVQSPFYELAENTSRRLIQAVAQLIILKNYPPLINYRLAMYDPNISFDFLDHLDMFSRHFIVEQASLYLVAPQLSHFSANRNNSTTPESGLNETILKTFDSRAKTIILQFAQSLLDENKQVVTITSNQNFIHMLQMKIIDTIYTKNETNKRYLINIVKSIPNIVTDTLDATAIVETFTEYYSCLINSLTDVELMTFYNTLLKPVLQKTKTTVVKDTTYSVKKIETQVIDKFLCYSSDESD